MQQSRNTEDDEQPGCISWGNSRGRTKSAGIEQSSSATRKSSARSATADSNNHFRRRDLDSSDGDDTGTAERTERFKPSYGLGHGISRFRHEGREPGVHDGCTRIRRRYKCRRISYGCSENEKNSEESDVNFIIRGGGGGGGELGRGGGGTVNTEKEKDTDVLGHIETPNSISLLEQYNQQPHLLHNEQERQSQAASEEELQ
ncbi:unnamed protein product, partial [Allacma fusca]